MIHSRYEGQACRQVAPTRNDHLVQPQSLRHRHEIPGQGRGHLRGACASVAIGGLHDKQTVSAVRFQIDAAGKTITH